MQRRPSRVWPRARLALAGACLVLVGACQAEQGDPVGAAGDSGLGGETGGEGSGAEAPSWPEPDWSAEEVGHALDAAFGQDLGLGLSWLEAYLGARAEGDDDCPGEGVAILDNQIPVEGCVAASGASFNGVAHVGVQVEGSDFMFDMNGDLEVVHASGEVLRLGGWSYLMAEGYGTDELSWRSEQAGSLLDEASEPWLGEGVSSYLYGSGGRDAERGTWISLTGGHGTLSTGVSLSFEDFTLSGMGGTGACAGRAAGLLRVRDPVGSWHRLDFGEDCAPCATVAWADGTELGEVCPDLEAWAEALAAGTDLDGFVAAWP